MAAAGLVVLGFPGSGDADGGPLARVEEDRAANGRPDPDVEDPGGERARATAARPGAPAVDADPSPAPDGAAPPLAHLVLDLEGPEGEGLPGRAELRRPGRRPEPVLATAELSPTDPVRMDLDEVGPFVLRLGHYPTGYMPPAEASGQVFVDQPHLEFDLELELQPGTNRRTVRLQAATRVTGHVRDDAGRGVPGVLVCAHVQGTERPKDHYGTTDASGAYSFLATPGRARIQVHLVAEHPWSSAARPLPRDRTLLPNAIEVVDFRLTRAGASVSGTLSDQDGVPMAGMYVLCTHRPDQSHLPEEERAVYTLRDHVQSAHTDATGRFHLEGLPPGRYSVLIGPEDYRPVGKGRLGMRIPIRVVEVGESEHVDLGPVDAWSSRPFRVTGSVELGAARPGRDSPAEDLQVVAVLQAGARRTSLREEVLELREEGGRLVFDWACETPEDGVLLELRGPGDRLVQVPVWPTPDQRVEVTLRVPD